MANAGTKAPGILIGLPSFLLDVELNGRETGEVTIIVLCDEDCSRGVLRCWLAEMTVSVL